MTSGAVESKELSDCYFLMKMSTFSNITIKLLESKGTYQVTRCKVTMQIIFFSKETISNSKVKFKNKTLRIIL